MSSRVMRSSVRFVGVLSGSLLLSSSFSGHVGAQSYDPADGDHRNGTTGSVVGKPLTLERIYQDPPLEGRAPMQLAFSPDGTQLVFLQPNLENSDVLDLWARSLRPDGTVGEPTTLVKTSDLVAVDQIKLSEQERMALERKRVRHTGITSYLWCGDKGEALLFPLSGDLYHVALKKDGQPLEKPLVQRLTNDEAPEIDPSCSSSGTQIAFIKDNNLWTMSLSDGSSDKNTNKNSNKSTKTKASKSTNKNASARALTTGASATKSFGLAEFIAQEEMDRQTGYYWSSDGKKIAYFEVDESPVSTKMRPQIFADHTEMFEQRYPAAGEANAKVRLWVVDVETGKSRVIATPAEKGDDGYFPRAGFDPQGSVWFQWQSRDQRTLTLYRADTPNYAPTAVLVEKDDVWVEISDDLSFIDGGKSFLWSSERSGKRQMYRVSRDGQTWQQLTNLPEALVHLDAVDETTGQFYFSAFTDRGRQQHIFAASYQTASGTDLNALKVQKITTSTGWHQAAFSGDTAFFVDKSSNFGQPVQAKLHKRDGAMVLSLVDAESQKAAQELAATSHSIPQWVDVPTSDGTILNGVLLPPTDLQKGQKYPVITYVYGGPGGPLVMKKWMRFYPFFTYLNQRGYGVFMVDNRGTGNRDRAFARAMYHNIGSIDIEDQQKGAAFLRTIPWVDTNRLGIFGWSYGGFASAQMILSPTNPYLAAASIAPVTDWRLYDTHYTERFLSKPQDFADLYKKAGVLGKGQNLKKPFLLVHGTADDNVLFENSLQLITELENQSIPFDLMIYPGKAHGISGKSQQLHLMRTLERFFASHLK